MKELINKTQQKIYAIFQTLKSYASKLRISSFVMNSVYVLSHKNWEGEQIIKICQSRIDAEYYINNEYSGIHESDELSISKWDVIHYS